MDFTNSQKTILILAIVAVVTIFILWPDSSEKPSKARHAEAQPQEVESRGPARRFHITHVVDDTTANRLRPSEQKHLDSTKIASGQTTLIAKDDEQYLAILERLAELGIRPRGTLEALRSINVILDDATLDRLKNEFDDIAAAQDNIVWIPEDSIEPWSGRLGPGFGSRLLDWLGIDAAKEKRGDGVTVAVLDTAISKSVVNQNADIKQIDLFDYSQNASETGHGNAVASLLVADDRELSGLAPSIELLSIPVLDANGEGSAFDLAKGIIAAVDAGANVISMSLGSYTNSALLKAAVDYAAAAGVVLVGAAGNDGVNQVSPTQAAKSVSPRQASASIPLGRKVPESLRFQELPPPSHASSASSPTSCPTTAAPSRQPKPPNMSSTTQPTTAPRTKTKPTDRACSTTPAPRKPIRPESSTQRPPDISLTPRTPRKPPSRLSSPRRIQERKRLRP